jgi:PAS domain-containing protein
MLLQEPHVHTAEMVIAKFGGQSALARLVGKGQSTVQHWANSGRIPAKWQSQLLLLAREHSIDLSVQDFVGGSAHSHIVQFYDDDSFLIERVARFIGSALESRNGAVVVVTKSHRDRLAECLRRRGFDTASLLREGRYIVLNAAETLSKFMVNGKPDSPRFEATLRDVIGRANRTSNNEHPRAAVFGEMVALLWKDGKRQAAIELEQMWNELERTCDFSLLCGYPMSAFSREERGQEFMEVCAHHVDVIPAESYSALTEGSERRRSIARLQQRAQALETEIRRSEEQLNLMQAVAGMGSWEMDLDDDSISLSRHAQEMLGLDVAGRLLLPDFLQTMYVAPDRARFTAAVKRARTGRKEFTVQFRVKPNGRIKELSAHGKIIYNFGQPLIVGLLKETTPQ